MLKFQDNNTTVIATFEDFILTGSFHYWLKLMY